MKSIKEWTLRYWVVAYLIFIIVLGVLSNLFGKVGVNIHPDYLFAVVFLMHLIRATKSYATGNTNLKRFILFALIFFLIKISIDEWYGYITVMDVLFKIIFIVGVVWILYYRIKQKKKIEPESAKPTKSIKNK